MRKIISLLTLCCIVLCFAGCGEKSGSTDISNAKSIADLKGAKISAQTGTFHAEAAKQIENVKCTTYPEFADLLTALKSGAIDGYIAEEPTALAECQADNSITYLPLKNNDTGFKTSKEDTGIAVGLKTGSALRDKINKILSEIPEETKSALMEQMVKIAAGEDIKEFALKSETPATTNGVLKVGMECAYRPFNWTETEAKTHGAVPISSAGNNGYANGYDVQMAQYIANKLGMKLEIYAIEWDSLLPALESGTIDAIAAGMSPTAEREKEIDFTDTYYESNLVVIIKK